jgi:hypothetical protein
LPIGAGLLCPNRQMLQRMASDDLELSPPQLETADVAILRGASTD